MSLNAIILYKQSHDRLPYLPTRHLVVGIKYFPVNSVILLTSFPEIKKKGWSIIVHARYTDTNFQTTQSVVETYAHFTS